MSKQSNAKEAQGYEQRPVLPCCKSCQSLYVRNLGYGGYIPTCAIGGFSVKAMATCREYHRKGEP